MTDAEVNEKFEEIEKERKQRSIKFFADEVNELRAMYVGYILKRDELKKNKQSTKAINSTIRKCRKYLKEDQKQLNDLLYN